MKNKPNVFFFILFIDFFLLWGKASGHTAKSNISNRGKTEHRKKEKKKENKTTDKEMTQNLDSFSAGKKYKLLNTEMYNKATKTNGFHDHFVKEGNSPQSKEREEKKNTEGK